MIDKSKKHSYNYYKDTQVVKYFDKYDFSESADTISDIKYKDSPYSFTKTELLAASILAAEFNSSYVKTSGAFDIVEGDFVKTGFSNKDVLIGILTKYPKLITDKEREKATVILDFLDNEFAFKILSETLTDFEQSITKFLSDKSSDFLRVIGVAAYIPTYYDNNTLKENLRDRSINSGHLGKVGEKIKAEIEILTSTYIAETQYGGSGYMVNAITTDDNRLSFFTTNEDIATSKTNINISCKIKSLGTAWKDDSIPETKVNYVRMVENLTGNSFVL
jgi:hypothetical protein